MTKVIERFEEYIKFKGYSLNSVDVTLELSNGYIGKQIKNKASIGSDILQKIISTYEDINVAWLMAGDGPMIGRWSKKLSDTDLEERSKAIKTKEKLKDNGVPIIPIEAMAGYGKGDKTVMEYEVDQRFVIPTLKGVDFFIQVSGDSMLPKYNGGDLVACRYVKELIFIQWGRVYVLDTSQGAVIKRLQPSENENEVICVSDNKEYKPFKVPITDIRSISLVVGAVVIE